MSRDTITSTQPKVLSFQEALAQATTCDVLPSPIQESLSEDKPKAADRELIQKATTNIIGRDAAKMLFEHDTRHTTNKTDQFPWDSTHQTYRIVAVPHKHIQLENTKMNENKVHRYAEHMKVHHLQFGPSYGSFLPEMNKWTSSSGTQVQIPDEVRKTVPIVLIHAGNHRAAARAEAGIPTVPVIMPTSHAVAYLKTHGEYKPQPHPQFGTYHAVDKAPATQASTKESKESTKARIGQLVESLTGAHA